MTRAGTQLHNAASHCAAHSCTMWERGCCNTSLTRIKSASFFTFVTLHQLHLIMVSFVHKFSSIFANKYTTCNDLEVGLSYPITSLENKDTTVFAGNYLSSFGCYNKTASIPTETLRRNVYRRWIARYPTVIIETVI